MLIKLVHFQNKKLFLLLFKQTFLWYMSKMYLWVLTLVTIFDPTLIGQLSLSLLMTFIKEVASSSISLWGRLSKVDLLVLIEARSQP
jgi:hypothetical protein